MAWAPPPMLVEAPPPMPYEGAVWVGGYWVWRANWVWASGHWMGPPQPGYVWRHPYYENRGGAVVFVDGYWSAPGVAFVRPPPTLPLVYARPAYGVIPGPRAVGPDGCFVPPPPGSRLGIIVPAPVGTAPAVVTGAPPVIAPGMRVTNTSITSVNSTRITNVTNVTNITNVTIVAPATATASGRAFSGAMPAAPHLAAARPAVVQVRAPPVASRPLAPFTPPPANTYGARPVASGGEPLPRSGLGQAAAQGGRPESYTPPGAPMRVPEPHPAAGLGSANYGVPAYPVARPAAPAPVPPPAHATAAPSAAPAAPAHSVSPAARPVQAAHPATPAPAATNTHPQPRQPNPPPPRKNERDEGQQR